MLNTKNNFKALSLSTESEVLNSHKLHTCNNEKGRSMIEMLGVLAIIGVLSVGGIAGYSKAMMKFKTNKTIDQIAMTVTNIRTLYAQQLNYDITTADAYNMGVVDDAMVGEESCTGKDENKKCTATLKNAFGGSVFIKSAASGMQGTTTGAFLVTFAGLPREACVNIATNDWGSNYSSGLLGIGTGVNASIADAADLACGVANAGSNPKGSDATGVQKACATENRVFRVDEAATGCDCANANTCYVTFKYY